MMDGAPDSVAMVDTHKENLEISSAVVKEKTSSENSEYDSVDSYSDEDEQLVIKARSKASGLDSHSDNEGSVILEREEGDGQESVPSKKVDDDEDKKNPQYIPKRGTFYEHDDRTADDVENQEPEDPEKAEKEGKKKVWQDKKERWTHDRFNDQEQTPKSRAELIAIYGYDIRNEDGPPRARRRRRYGRGPNKYTRNWEDEDAYSKPPPNHTPRSNAKTGRPTKNRSTEEFPPLGSAGRNNRARTKSRSSESNQEDAQPTITETPENDNEIRKSHERQDSKRQTDHQQAKENGSNKQITEIRQEIPLEQNYNKSTSSRVGTGRTVKPVKEIKDSDYRGFTSKSRLQRGVRSDNQKVLPPRNKKENDFIQTQNFTNKNNNNNNANQIAEMEKEISQLNIQDGVYKGGNKHHNSGNNQNRQTDRQGSVPPRLQNSEPKGSKRYSSMRQRSLPESGTPPAVNFSFYPTDYNSTAPPPATQQPLLPNPIPPPTTLVAPQVPVTAAPPPLLQTPFPPPAAFAAQPPPQAYLQAAPPPFIAAPAPQPQMVSYVAQAPPAAFVQGFQGQFNTVTQPAELYQPQGGITYYSTDQQVIQRALPPQKRPKAAIPIVAPTDFKEAREQKDGDKTTTYQEQREEPSFSTNEIHQEAIE